MLVYADNADSLKAALTRKNFSARLTLKIFCPLTQSVFGEKEIPINRTFSGLVTVTLSSPLTWLGTFDPNRCLKEGTSRGWR